MSTCWCKVVMSILVIVFAWVEASWQPIALTVLGALLLIASLIGTCCCTALREKCATPTSDEPGGED